MRKISLATAKVTTLAGNRLVGGQDGLANANGFFYPTGLCIIDSTLYIADTNNNAIRAVAF